MGVKFQQYNFMTFLGIWCTGVEEMEWSGATQN